MEKLLRLEGAKAGTWVWYRSVSPGRGKEVTRGPGGGCRGPGGGCRGPGDCCRGPGGCGFLTRAWVLLLLLLVRAVVIT